MSKHLGRSKIVDSDHLIALCAKHLSESKTSDTTETIDCNFYCHNKKTSYEILNEMYYGI